MKKIITIIIIIVALAGAIILGYSALKKKAPPTANPAVVTILPYGTTLDFDNLQAFNKTNRLFPYPIVAPTEVGTQTGALVR